MKIGIYVRGLSEKSGGAKVFLENLTKSLIETIPEKYDFYIIHNLEKKYFITSKRNTHEILLKSKSKLISDFILAPLKINSLNLDICLFPKNVIPLFIKCKKIVIILDLLYYLPKYNAYKIKDKLYMHKMIKSSCEKADKIIAISKNTKRDLGKILNINENKIGVIYLAAGKSYKKLEQRSLNKIKLKYNLPNKFIFYSGSISPRKNLIRLIKAFEKIQDKIDYDLVITGNKLWNNKEEMQMIKKNNHIKVLGFVPEVGLVALYNLAEVYVYPSLYEGFGLPILEAQACGCPVICSNTSSLPEVAGDSTYYIDPYNEKDIADAIIKLSKNKKLREELIKKGYKNIKRFSWNKSARNLLKVCEEVYNKK